LSDLEVFGPFTLDTAPEEALESTLKEWLPTYLAFVSRRSNLSLPQPRSYVISYDFDHLPEEQLPALQIICPRIERPEADGQRIYRATFPLTVGVFIEARDRFSTDRLVKLYASAVRALVLHKGSLGGLATATTWIGTNYGSRTAARAQRTIGTAEVHFRTEVRQLVQRLVGPEITTTPNPVTEPGVEQPPLPRVSKTSLTEKPEPA